MRIWIALIVAPLLALTDQVLALSLVSWSCSHQSRALIHTSHLVFLALTALAATAAWRAWRKTSLAPAAGSERALQIRFLTGVAATVASLSALAIAAMWLPTWMISSCVA